MIDRQTALLSIAGYNIFSKNKIKGKLKKKLLRSWQKTNMANAKNAISSTIQKIKMDWVHLISLRVLISLFFVDTLVLMLTIMRGLLQEGKEGT